MTLSEKLVSVLGPLCGGRVYFDETPKDGPEGIPYIVCSLAGGRRFFFVENERPDNPHHRVSIVGVTKFPSDRDVLADAIENAMCKGGFPACEPYGGPISGSSVAHEELYSQQQFGVNY